MNHPNADSLNAERDALIQEIRAAFANVTLGKGCSWAETKCVDDRETDEKVFAEARKEATDTHWSQLVEDPRWRPYPGNGGFWFIDPLGFRYYLPPAMIRLASDPRDDDLGSLVEIIDQFREKTDELFDSRQIRCIARFIEFISRHPGILDEYSELHCPNYWRESFDSYWHQYLT